MENTNELVELTCYGYSESHREYIGMVLGFQVGEIVHLPVNTTITPIPEETIPEGQALVFTEAEEWIFVEDHRGESVYVNIDNPPITIDAPGPYPANVITVAPPEQHRYYYKADYVNNTWILDTTKKQQLLELCNTKANTMRSAAYRVAFPFMDKLIQLRNEEDLALITNAVTKAKADPTFTVTWICEDNTGLMLTAEQIIAMEMAMIDRNMAVFMQYAQIKQSLTTMTTAELMTWLTSEV